MANDNDDKKIGKVQKSTTLKEIQKAQTIDSVRKTGAVTGVSGADSSKRGPTRVMSIEERDALLNMVTEEAEKMFGKSKISSEQREAIEEAVKITIDASIVDEEDQ